MRRNITYSPVLVLNASYEPLHVCAARRALTLIVKGVALITKSTAAGITVNAPTAGSITIEIMGANTSGLTSGDYYHIAEFTPLGGQKRGVFDGIATIDNRTGGD